MSRSTKLAELVIEETSGVDHPAHLHEGWVVMKTVNFDQVLDTPELDTNTLGETVELEKSAPESEDVRKELADLRKAHDEAKAENELLKATFVAIEDERSLEKALESAHSWAILPELNPVEFAAHVRDLRKSAPEIAAAFEAVLTASARALGDTNILKEIGTAASNDSNNAWDTITSRANDLVASGQAENFAKAVSVVAQADKNLYSQYLTEKGI